MRVVSIPVRQRTPNTTYVQAAITLRARVLLTVEDWRPITGGLHGHVTTHQGALYASKPVT